MSTGSITLAFRRQWPKLKSCARTRPDPSNSAMVRIGTSAICHENVNLRTLPYLTGRAFPASDLSAHGGRDFDRNNAPPPYRRLLEISSGRLFMDLTPMQLSRPCRNA